MDTPEIDVDQLAERLEAGQGVLVDVRQPEEWVDAHIDGAVLVPLGDLPDRVDELPTDGELMVICRSGNRSAVATNALNASGRDAVNVAGGMLAWIESGRQIARDEG